MASKIVITDIVELVSKIKEKIDKYKNSFQRNEMLVRYALIDPFLRILGWNTEDPDQVEPEYNTEAGIPDYALKVNGVVVAFVEAKALQKEWNILKLITYANAKGVPYVIATDGDKWEVYDVFRPVEVSKKLVVSWQITRDNPVEIALKALSIANLKGSFGVPPVMPLLIKGKTRQKEGIVSIKERKIFKGPLNTKLARLLVLQVLAESDKPLRRKDIVKEVGRRVKLTEHDMERTTSGRIRWEATVRWTISNLAKEGLIEKVEKGIYKINEKGLEELRKSVNRLA